MTTESKPAKPPKPNNLYCLMINGKLYDTHDKLETVERWFSFFKKDLDNNIYPHRFFHKFDGKIEMTIVVVDLSSAGKVLTSSNHTVRK